MRGAVQGYQLVPGHSSSLLCLSLNQVGLQVLEKAKPLEVFLCLSVNANLVQFKMCMLYPWRSMDVRYNCLTSSDKEIPLPQLLYTSSTWLLKHQALHQME